MSLVRFTVNPIQAQTPVPSNAVSQTVEGHTWSCLGLLNKDPSPRTQPEQPTALHQPCGHRLSPKEMLWTSMWSPLLSWFSSSACFSLHVERNPSSILGDVHTLCLEPSLISPALFHQDSHSPVLSTPTCPYQCSLSLVCFILNMGPCQSISKFTAQQTQRLPRKLFPLW